MSVRGGRETPRHNLKAARANLLEISPPCLKKANDVFQIDEPVKLRRQVVALFHSLVETDFCHVEKMGETRRGPLEGDVYGKVVDEVLWFIKIRVVKKTVIMSCHEAERDLTLANGTVLKGTQ